MGQGVVELLLKSTIVSTGFRGLSLKSFCLNRDTKWSFSHLYADPPLLPMSPIKGGVVASQEATAKIPIYHLMLLTFTVRQKYKSLAIAMFF